MTIQNPDKSLAEFRRSIDAIDAKILDSINQRLEIAKEIGAVKIRKGAQVIDPERESTLIERLIACNKGPLTKESLYHIFKEIITISRQIQTPHFNDYPDPTRLQFTPSSAIRSHTASAPSCTIGLLPT